MPLESLQCPACSAPVIFLPQSMQTKCSYCGAMLRKQPSSSEVALLTAEKVTGAINTSSAQTQTAIQASTAAAQAESAATRNELRRMQLSNELTSVDFQLATVQSDIRAAMRMPRNRVISQQLRQLQGQEAVLLRRRADIEAILNPRRPPSLPVSRPGSSRGCVGWAFLLLAWLFFWPIMLPWTLIRSESRALQIAGYALAALFAFWILMGVIAGQ